MLPPQLNLVIEIEFADATTVVWSENAGARPAGATLSTDFEIQNVRVLASQVVLDSALVESFNRVLLSGRSLVFSYPTVHTQQSSVPHGVAEHNVTVARAFTKLMGAFVTFWDNDAGSKIHLLANPGQDPHRPGRRTASWSLRCAGQPAVPSQPMKGASERFHSLSLEGVSQMVYILPERLPALVRGTSPGSLPNALNFNMSDYMSDEHVLGTPGAPPCRAKPPNLHSPPGPCYMCYMCYILHAKPLNIHSPPGPCYMYYMCYILCTREICTICAI